MGFIPPQKKFTKTITTHIFHLDAFPNLDMLYEVCLHTSCSIPALLSSMIQYCMLLLRLVEASQRTSLRTPTPHVLELPTPTPQMMELQKPTAKGFKLPTPAPQGMELETPTPQEMELRTPGVARSSRRPPTSVSFLLAEEQDHHSQVRARGYHQRLPAQCVPRSAGSLLVSSPPPSWTQSLRIPLNT